MERAMERTAAESDAINCGKIKTDCLELIIRIGRVTKMINDLDAKENLNSLRCDLIAALYDSMNAGMDGIATTIADLDADDDALYRREVRADYHKGVL